MPFKFVHGVIVHEFVKMGVKSDSESYLCQNTHSFQVNIFILHFHSNWQTCRKQCYSQPQI